MNHKLHLESQDMKKLPSKSASLNPKEKKHAASAAPAQSSGLHLHTSTAVQKPAPAAYVMPPQLQAALNQVWQKSLPLLQQRVGVLDDALAATKAGQLNPELRAAAALEAHRLAGLLGTFGYPEGTDAARMFEIVFDSDAILAPQLAETLAPALTALRTIVNA